MYRGVECLYIAIAMGRKHMKLYYFAYTNKEGEFFLEVSGSQSKARKKLCDLRREEKLLVAEWATWLGNKNLPRPKSRLTLPMDIRQATIQSKGKEAVMEAFNLGVIIGRIMK